MVFYGFSRIQGRHGWFTGYEYNEQYQITAGGGDSFVADHTDVENYDDARKAAAAIEDYFRNHGGTAEQTEAKGLELD